MAGLGQLSPDDLVGATVVPAPPAPAPPSTPSLGTLDESDLEPEAPSVLGSLGRKALAGATADFSDEIVGALSATFGDGKGSFGDRYRAGRDAYRDKLQLDQETNPIASTVGEIGGALVPALIPGGAAVEAGAIAEAAPSLGKLALKGAMTGAKYGAMQGLGGSTADLTQGDFGTAIKDTLTGAAIGGAAGAVLHPAATKLLEGSPERLADDIIQEITAGEGKAGSATVKAKKLVDQDKADIIATVMGDKELSRAVGKRAKEALPVVERKMEEVGSQLDPLYKSVAEKVGGVSLKDGWIKPWNDEIAELAKDPLNEAHIKAIEDIRDSGVKAWAPAEKVFDPEKIVQGGALDGMKAGEAVAMLEKVPKTPEIEAAINGIKDAASSEQQNLDVLVDPQKVRKTVTRLQTRGTQIINALNPTESTAMKAELGALAKAHFDAYLDKAAQLGGKDVEAAVAKIRDINSTYSALANINKAISQRAWKENTGSTSLAGHGANLLGLGLGGGMLLHGNIPGAIAAAVLGKVAPGAIRASEHEANRILAQIVTDAAAGKSIAKLTKAAIEKGVPRAAILQAVKSVNRALGQQ